MNSNNKGPDENTITLFPSKAPKDEVAEEIQIARIRAGEMMDLENHEIDVDPIVPKILTLSDEFLGKKGRKILTLYLPNLEIKEGDTDEKAGKKIKEFLKKYSQSDGMTMYEHCLDLLSGLLE